MISFAYMGIVGRGITNDLCRSYSVHYIPVLSHIGSTDVTIKGSICGG
jgi:hypothetical protein